MKASAHRSLIGPPQLLVLPAVLLIGGLYLFALLRVLWLSFSDPSFGLGNYRLLLSDATIQRVIWTTVWICVVTTVITVVIGYLIAYAMAHVQSRERRLILLCIMLSFWLSVLVRTFAWVMLLQRNGVVNELFLSLGVISHPLTMIYNSAGVIIGMVHVMVPLATLPIYANLSAIDQSLMDAARGLGCRPTKSFLYVYLPLSKEGIAAATVLVFVFSLGFYITPAILGGGKVLMIAEYIEFQFHETLRWGVAAMMATLLLIAVLLVLALASRVTGLQRLTTRTP
jgi:putative spermidine/putrescine transport system permease protein